mgnify:CR=1 FL=1
MGSGADGGGRARVQRGRAMWSSVASGRSPTWRCGELGKAAAVRATGWIGLAGGSTGRVGSMRREAGSDGTGMACGGCCDRSSHGDGDEECGEREATGRDGGVNGAGECGSDPPKPVAGENDRSSFSTLRKGRAVVASWARRSSL